MRTSFSASSEFDPLQGLARRLRELHGEARRAQLLAELLAKELGDVGLVVDDQDQRAHLTPPAFGGAFATRLSPLAERGRVRGVAIGDLRFISRPSS